MPWATGQTNLLPEVTNLNQFDCAGNAAKLAALVNEEILLAAAKDVAQVKRINAENALDTASHAADVANMKLMANRAKQLELQGLANANGC
jgi:hypothetical protein